MCDIRYKTEEANSKRPVWLALTISILWLVLVTVTFAGEPPPNRTLVVNSSGTLIFGAPCNPAGLTTSRALTLLQDYTRLTLAETIVSVSEAWFNERVEHMRAVTDPGVFETRLATITGADLVAVEPGAEFNSLIGYCLEGQ